MYFNSSGIALLMSSLFHKGAQRTKLSYFNFHTGSQQCTVTISCDSGWTGVPDVRFDEAGTLGDGGGGGDDDEDGISFLQLFTVSTFCCFIFHHLDLRRSEIIPYI